MAWHGRVFAVAFAAACVVALLLAATANVSGVGGLARGLRASPGAPAETSNHSNISNARIVAPVGVQHVEHESAGSSHASTNRTAASAGGSHASSGKTVANSTVKQSGGNGSMGGKTASPPLPASTFNQKSTFNATKPDQEGATELEASGGGCLCLFDIDRTLTGSQSDDCGGRNYVVRGVHDPAYRGGTLTLSALGRAGVGSTFCGGCHVGFVSAGSGGGGRMRGRLAGGFLGGRGGYRWSGPRVWSPLVIGCHDGRKSRCASGILAYYRRRGANIPRNNVYFFDDKCSSVSSFRGSGMNARQVSCNSRDYGGATGGCGASPGEVRRSGGVRCCR